MLFLNILPRIARRQLSSAPPPNHPLPHALRSSSLISRTSHRPFSQPTMSAIEEAKRNAAREAVANHYPPNAKFIGIGSGTTIVYVVEAIKALGIDTSFTSFVPTGYQSNQLIV